MRGLSPQLSVDERVSTLTHGLGVILSIAGTVALVLKALRQGTPIDVVSAVLYGLSLIMLFSASTLYHGSTEPRRKHRLLVFDHVSIYLLIAGTYTPICLGVGGPWGWGLFAAIWTIAALGVGLKFLFWGRFEILHVVFYLLMGWMILIAYKPFLPLLPDRLIAWAVAGGLAYSVGTIFFLVRSIPFNHTLWHLFVLAGSACFYIGIYLDLVKL
ncbi:MAG: hemolysin III family protein [Pseudomonadota bacterium]